MDRFGQYRLVSAFYTGLFGGVFVAVHEETGEEFAVKLLRPDPVLMNMGDYKAHIESSMERIGIQQQVVAGGSRRWAMIRDVITIEERIYCVMPRYPWSARKLVTDHIDLSARQLSAIVLSVIDGIIELQKTCNRPHGRLSLENILLEHRPHTKSWEVALADPCPAAELHSRPSEKPEDRDLRDIGMLIYELVTHKHLAHEGTTPDMSERWRKLGRTATAWNELCAELLGSPLDRKSKGIDEVRARVEVLAKRANSSLGAILVMSAVAAVLLAAIGGGAYLGVKNFPQISQAFHRAPEPVIAPVHPPTPPGEAQNFDGATTQRTVETTTLPVTQEAIVIPATGPATAPATQVAIVIPTTGPATAPATQEAIVIPAIGPTTAPATQEAIVIPTTGPATAPATQQAIVVPATGPATAMATQPTVDDLAAGQMRKQALLDSWRAGILKQPPPVVRSDILKTAWNQWRDAQLASAAEPDPHVADQITAFGRQLERVEQSLGDPSTLDAPKSAAAARERDRLLHDPGVLKVVAPNESRLAPDRMMTEPLTTSYALWNADYDAVQSGAAKTAALLDNAYTLDPEPGDAPNPLPAVVADWTQRRAGLEAADATELLGDLPQRINQIKAIASLNDWAGLRQCAATTNQASIAIAAWRKLAQTPWPPSKHPLAIALDAYDHITDLLKRLPDASRQIALQKELESSLPVFWNNKLKSAKTAIEVSQALKLADRCLVAKDALERAKTLHRRLLHSERMKFLDDQLAALNITEARHDQLVALLKRTGVTDPGVAKQVALAREFADGNMSAGELSRKLDELTKVPDTLPTIPTTTPVVKHPPPPSDRVTFTDSVGLVLVEITPGKFDMGSPEGETGRHSDEKRHTVTLTHGFLMGQTPVTRGQFAQFVKDTTYKTDAERQGWSYAWNRQQDVEKKNGANWQNPGFEQTDEHPVVCVSWNDARSFCLWVMRKDKHTCRLPSEAEWEYCCRAGKSRVYFWGDDPADGKDYCNASDHSTNQKIGTEDPFSWDDPYLYTSPVKSFLPNDWALFDMSGNAWQWCGDGYASFASQAKTDPNGAPLAVERVIRGGGWDSGVRLCRAASRHSAKPDARFNDTGFRIVIEH